MSVKKLISSVTVFLFAVCMLSAVSYSVEYSSIREPDTRKRRDDDYVGLIIKTTPDDADIYINGKAFGKSPLATVDLGATTYTLEIRKSGYDTIKCRIQLRKHYTYTYNFVMQKTCGFIDVSNVPSGSTVYVDGVSHSSFPIEVSPGSHTVKVRKFGYQDFSESIYVENHATVGVRVSLITAPFELRNFRVSKKQINPDYKSSIGKITISFSVTNTGSALITINDRYGNTVWSYNFSSFSTWEQSVSWNGFGNDNEVIPDGEYTVNLYSMDYSFSERIKVDRSLSYPLTAYTTSGSGIGTIPCAFSSGVNYTKLSVAFGPECLMSDNSFKVSSFPVTGVMQFGFSKHFEMAGSFTIYPGMGASNISVRAGGSIKGTASMPIVSSLNLNFAGLLNYNYCNNKSMSMVNGVLSGFKLGAAAGLEGKSLFLGVSGEYNFNPDGNVMKTGAALSLLPVNNVRASIWGALYNAEVVEAGVEFITMPASTAFSFDVKAYILKELNDTGKNFTANAQIGLSYLF